MTKVEEDAAVLQGLMAFLCRLPFIMRHTKMGSVLDIRPLNWGTQVKRKQSETHSSFTPSKRQLTVLASLGTG